MSKLRCIRLEALLRVLKNPRAARSHSRFECRGGNEFDTTTLAVLQCSFDVLVQIEYRTQVKFSWNATGVFGPTYQQCVGSCFLNLQVAAF